MRFPRSERGGATQSGSPRGTASPASDWQPLEPLPTTQPACCCSAHPVVQVLIPSAVPGREPADLLMCGHHFRASREALEVAGAAAFDADGGLVLPRSWEPDAELLAARAAD